MEIHDTRKPLTYGNSCKVKCLRKGNPKKSLVNGNPLYKEIPHTGEKIIQGEPLVNVTGITCKEKSINYTRTRIMFKNRVNFIQQRSASTSEPFRGIKCTCENVKKPSGKAKKPKQPKRSRQNLSKTIGETKKQKENKTFGPMSPRMEMGPKVVFIIVVLSMLFLIVVVLTSVVVLVCLVFPVAF